jgi:RuvB-like protein 2
LSSFERRRTAARRRKSDAVEVEDVSKAYTLFLDVQRSVGFLKEFSHEYAYDEMDDEGTEE